MATERYKKLQGALLSKDLLAAELLLSVALGIDPPEQHPVRVRDKELLGVFEKRYKLEWLIKTIPLIEEMVAENKKQKAEIKKLKSELKKLKAPIEKVKEMTKQINEAKAKRDRPDATEDSPQKIRDGNAKASDD